MKAGRERGPSVSERRAKEQAAEAAEAATKKAKKISVKRALGEALRVVGAAAIEKDVSVAPRRFGELCKLWLRFAEWWRQKNKQHRYEYS